MSLTSQCERILINKLKTIPPVLLEQIIQQTRESIRKDLEEEVRAKVIGDIKEYLPEMIKDHMKSYTESLISPIYKKPTYPANIPEDIQKFARHTAEELINYQQDTYYDFSSTFNNIHTITTPEDSDLDTDEEEEYGLSLIHHNSMWNYNTI